MEVNKELIQNIATLARLEFKTEAEQEQIRSDLSNMLNMVDKLNELDLDNVEPLIYITDVENVLRADEVRQEISKEQALENAPQKDSDYIKVPKVLSQPNE
ncbi:MAG: Asp-tRNA(Asn)/Glu-tRNA(Gln) amidotransferase subunit GatC [Chitinophagales bacterium]